MVRCGRRWAKTRAVTWCIGTRTAAKRWLPTAGYGAYGANQAGEWRLVTLASYDAILAPVTESFNRTLGILFATLVAAVGLGLWLARRLADPILKITESAKTIAAGRFDARVAVTTRDEIGTLAEAFNLMAGTLQTEITQRAQAQESLRGANEELEQRVEERTTQLTAEIAERTRAEKELHQLHHKHELVLNAVGEGIHALDLDGQIIFENPAGEKMLGWESSELIGKPAHATMHHSKAGGAPYPQGECPILASLGDGSPRRISDEVFWRKDGTSFPVEYVTTPLRDENHEIIGAVVVFSDITESKRAEQELHHAKEAAEAANRAKSQFLALVRPLRTSHCRAGRLRCGGLCLHPRCLHLGRPEGDFVLGHRACALSCFLC